MKKRIVIGWGISLILIGVMSLAAELTGIRELIFPEMAALLTGSFLVKQRPWNVDHGGYTLVMSLSALAGFLVSRYLAAPLYFKVLLAAALVFGILLLSRRAMVPAISACALPVLIGTTEWIYVLSVVVIASVCDLGNYLMERSKLMEEKEYQPGNRNAAHWGRMLLIFAAVLLIPMLTGLKYMIAPPLIVAFVALSAPGGRDTNPPLLTIFLFTGTALIGFCCRILFEETLLPETICVMFAAAGAWVLFSATRRFFPPAAAIAILPFLLPSDGLWKYPLEIFSGITILYFAACLVSFWENRSGDGRI